jgi:hypothetical protein
VQGSATRFPIANVQPSSPGPSRWKMSTDKSDPQATSKRIGIHQALAAWGKIDGPRSSSIVHLILPRCTMPLSLIPALTLPARLPSPRPPPPICDACGHSGRAFEVKYPLSRGRQGSRTLTSRRKLRPTLAEHPGSYRDPGSYRYPALVAAPRLFQWQPEATAHPVSYVE